MTCMRNTMCVFGGWILLSVWPSMSTAGGSAFELCPSTAVDPGTEKQCHAAIAEAERAADSELLAQLLEGLAVMYEGEQRHEEAVVTLRRSIQVAAPDHSYNARKRLANLLEKSGELEEARVILESLVSETGSASRGETVRRGHIELQLADVYVKLEKPDLAEQYYKRSILDLDRGPEDDPTYPALVRLIRLYLQQGRNRDAIEACMEYKKSRGVGSASATEVCQKLGDRNSFEEGGEVTLK